MRKPAGLVVLAFAILLLSSACRDGAERGGSSPSDSPASGKIAFTSCQIEDPEDFSSQLCDIYVINADGSGVANLTNSPSYDIQAPVWSPDGSRIAFSSMNEDGSTDIFVINADGSGLVNLTGDPSYDREPVWSPDGTRIAFTSRTDPAAEPGATYGVYGDEDIHVMNADGSGRVNLTQGRTVDHLGDPAGDHFPHWSPDGSRLSFLSGPYNITVMNADGSDFLTIDTIDSDLGFDSAPVWSPDGSSLITSADDGKIYLLSVDGSSRVQLADGADPVWSPDGKQIAFWLYSGETSEYTMRVINPDGSGLASVINAPTGTGEPPVWSPDGSYLAFGVVREDHRVSYFDESEGTEVDFTPREIQVVNADGSGPWRLTDSPADDFAPAWQPQP